LEIGTTDAGTNMERQTELPEEKTEMTREERREIIENAVIDFIGVHYGETPGDACYDIAALAKAVENALEKNVTKDC